MVSKFIIRSSCRCDDRGGAYFPHPEQEPIHHEESVYVDVHMEVRGRRGRLTARAAVAA